MSSNEFKVLSMVISAIYYSLDDKQKENFKESFRLKQSEMFSKLDESEGMELSKARNEFLNILEGR